MNAELATFYGVTPPTGTGFQKVMLDPLQRAGIVTQPAILASNAKPNQTSPVLRGKFVREQLLCQQLPSPPANLVIMVPQVTPGSTTRQRFAMHESQSSCAACHKLMDGMGLGFEQYDPLGRWRTTDQGLPIDASGTIVATDDIDGDFVGGVALAQKLASSSETRGLLRARVVPLRERPLRDPGRPVHARRASADSSMRRDTTCGSSWGTSR